MTLHRAPVSAWLTGALAAGGPPVGLLLAPEGGGWCGDSFTPYAVVTPANARVKDQSQGEPWQSWDVPYQVTYFGVDAGQVEKLADEIRDRITGRVRVGLAAQTLTYVHATGVGGVAYTKQLDPPGYSQTDTITLEVQVDD